MRHPASRAWVWLLVLALLGFLVYQSGLDISFYSDDFMFYPDVDCATSIGYLIKKNPRTGFYRPIDAIFASCIQARFDFSTVPVHVVTLSLHTLLSFLVYVVLLTMGYSSLQAGLGSLFMLLSQANAFAVLSNDTLAQVAGTFFGCLSLWMLHLSLPARSDAANENSPRGEPRTYALSVLAFALALLSKESSLAFLLPGIAVIATNSFAVRAPGLRARPLFLASSPFVALALIYLAGRASLGLLGPKLGAGRYGFHIGANILENAGMLLAAALVPASSVEVFMAVRNADPLVLASTALASLVLLLLTGYGIWRSERRWLTLAVLVFGICALSPVIPLNHVSELYVYGFMPFVSVLTGIGLGEVAHRSTSLWRRALLAAALLALAGSHVTAVQSKASMMKKNGARAAALMEEIRPYVGRVPQGGALALLNPGIGPPEYSVYLVRGFNLVKFGEWLIKREAERDDITVYVLESGKFEPAHRNDKTLVLYLDGDAVRELR